MLHASYQNSININAKSHILFAMASEAELLTMKLSTMRDRWQTNIPFLEACDVDFSAWTRKVDAMVCQIEDDADNSEITVPPCRLSRNFLIDFHDILSMSDSKDKGPKPTPYYKEKSMDDYFRKEDKIRREVSANWKEYLAQASDLAVQHITEPVGTFTFCLPYDEFLACIPSLNRLSDELGRLADYHTTRFSSDNFRRLALRILEGPEYGKSVKQTARTIVANKVNECSDLDLENELSQEIAYTYEQINDTRFGCKLLTNKYINPDINLETQYSGIGRFLYRYRKEIGSAELSDLLCYFHTIIYYQQSLSEEQHAAAPPTVAAPSVPQTEPVVLPVDFDQSFRADAHLSRHLVDVLRRLEPHFNTVITKSQIKRNPALQRFVGWKWAHLVEALRQLHILLPSPQKVTLADWFHQLFHNRSLDSITSGFYKYDKERYNGIVADVKVYLMEQMPELTHWQPTPRP